jgi:hypothetical protein
LTGSVLAVEAGPVRVDPGFTRTELVDLSAEGGLVDADAAVPMAVAVQTVLDIITADDPLVLTGQIVRAQPEQVVL